MKKNLLILTKIVKEKSKDCVNITDRKIDKKPFYQLRTKDENQS